MPQLSLRARRHAVASAAQRRLSAAAKAAAAAGTVVMAREPTGDGGIAMENHRKTQGNYRKTMGKWWEMVVS